MKQICIGILAHVDAGKTTLSEALLYRAGAIRRLGRVDHQDAFLDTDAMERQRGITIFSKQAVLELGETRVTLLDTPGHVDFSAEMERTLQVLDCAVLVISGTDGVQGHTRTLWDLLERYQVPTFLFINKMDLAGADREALLAHLKDKLSSGCVDFGNSDTLAEEAAVCDEAALEQYLETGELPEDMISRLIGERKLFPCYFGSALKVEGVEELLSGVEITDDTSLRRAADVLLSTGLHRVFISLGADGVFAADHTGNQVQLPPLPGTMVNTTGCGDAFMAAITWAYLQGTDLTDAVKAGLAASVIAMESAETINPAMSEDALRQRAAFSK